MYLIYNFTQAIELADRLAALSGYTARLYQLMDYLSPKNDPIPPVPEITSAGYSKFDDEEDEKPTLSSNLASRELDEVGSGIFVKDLTIYLPSKEVALRGKFQLP